MYIYIYIFAYIYEYCRGQKFKTAFLSSTFLGLKIWNPTALPGFFSINRVRSILYADSECRCYCLTFCAVFSMTSQ